MIKINLLLICSLLAVWNLFAGEVVITGVYQGKNIYVMNPFSSPGNSSFCITQILVNGKVVQGSFNSSSYEIELSDFQIKIGETVEVVIQHKEGCQPKILNRDALMSRSTFAIKSIKFDVKTNHLNWETSSESGPLPYIIERFRWNKWVRVGTVEGQGSYEKNNYSFPIELHSGINRFRVKQRDFTGSDKISREVSLRSTKIPVKFEPLKPEDIITFSADTDYEIFNIAGERVLHGSGKSVDITTLPKGEYYLNYDASTEAFKKR